MAVTVCSSVGIRRQLTWELSLFFNDTAPTVIYTLSLHDALPIWCLTCPDSTKTGSSAATDASDIRTPRRDRKSTRLNSSHLVFSYAAFCLKKKSSLLRPSFHALANRPAGRAARSVCSKRSLRPAEEPALPIAHD